MQRYRTTQWLREIGENPRSKQVKELSSILTSLAIKEMSSIHAQKDKERYFGQIKRFIQGKLNQIKLMALDR